MGRIKVIFIGGLTNGKIVFNYLNSNKSVDLVLSITYKDDVNKPRHINFPSSSKIIKSGTLRGLESKIINLNPDLILVAGWSEIIKNKILNIPKMGVVGFHPSKLPYDKGRSVIAWQILEGYKETALTMFYYNDIPDGGDIIAQELIKIDTNDYINDILDKVDYATKSLIKVYFPMIIKNKNPREKQNKNIGNFRRLRTEKDSIINWNSKSIEIYNLIRAISTPYPCAIGTIESETYKIFKSEIIDSCRHGKNYRPGEKIAFSQDNSIIVKTKDSFIKLTEYEKKC